MNYKQIYKAFIEKYKNQKFENGVYTEVHHILPRHAGGDDSQENLIRLTYKQHIFAHRLLWKAFGNSSDYCAWLLMSKQEVDKVVAGRKARGKANVESGYLARIRLKIDWKKVSELTIVKNKKSAEKGLLQEYCKKMNNIWRGSKHTEKWKEDASLRNKIRMQDKDIYNKQLTFLKKAAERRSENSKQESLNLILNAERNEVFLQKTTSKSLYKIISPEGLIFDSVSYAAKYYGNVENFVIDNWCKREQHGWKRILKANKD